ncbi:MAG: sigma-70 family RNA polymerase sigma factor [Ruminococcaceae bacterium]|jgi:RNA polymerase sigma-70 factor (ECF subfamily)|nr:sigma-70 family RNA polymerase sigma factor [Oscillospiraceae bacterium]
MDDLAIIALYFARDEEAIRQTDRKYGTFCRRVARNILTLPQDAEECVNDGYHAAWNAMPPQRPADLRAFLGRIVRNLSIGRWRREHAQKRYAGLDVMLSELEDCLPGRESTEQALERTLLTERIAAWLQGLPREDRVLFLRRYWYGESVKTLAAERGENANRTAQRMRKLRLALRDALEEGGFSV